MKPTTRRVMVALRRAGTSGLNTHDLAQPDVGGLRFGARIEELRRDHGCEIEARRERGGSFRYILKHAPAESGAVKSAGADPSIGPVAPDGVGPGGNQGKSNAPPPEGQRSALAPVASGPQPAPSDSASAGASSHGAGGELSTLFDTDDLRAKPGHDQIREEAA